MKIQNKLLLIATICTSACLTSYAEVITFNEPSDWQQEKLLKANGENAMKTEMSTTILSKKMIRLDKNSTYYISGTVKAAEGSAKGNLYYGFRIYDDKGVRLYSHHCVTAGGSDTELLEDTEPTDTSIVVKDGSKWKVLPYSVIAYNTKPDRSDLPNRNTLSPSIKKIEKTQNGWIIHLSGPVNAVLTAGTKVREHYRGGEYYCGLGNLKKPITLKKNRIWWWGGISQVQLLICASSAERGKKMNLDLSGLEVEIRENKKK